MPGALRWLYAQGAAMCLLEHWQQAHPEMMMESVCIRPGYVWPAQVSHMERQLPLCSDEGIAICTGTTGRQLAGLFSGCGPAGADVAVVASQILAGALAPQLLHDEQYNMAPAALEAAFHQCHQQLLQLQPQQHPAANTGPGSTLDTATSGASALLLALDQSRSKLLVASAGLCKAVLARSSPAGNLTVMELTPRLALGHDPAETARLDAAGTSICYQPPAAAAAAQGGPGSLPAGCSSNEAANNSGDSAGSAVAAGSSNAEICSSLVSNSYDSSGATTRSSVLDQPAAVLVAPDGSVLQHVGASRLLGCGAANSAGVLPTPVVTSWRLNGSESFVVLGSPGLWQAMNPAEVVDYVATALASGITSCSSSGPLAASAAAGKAMPSATAAAAAPAAAAAVSVGDLLTLEAQERLKMRLMDKLFGLCPGPAAPGAAGCVPDVSAVVLLMPGSPTLHAVAVDQQKMKQELAGMSRACGSNTEAQALQALWSASCFCCDRTLAGPPGPALSSLLPALSVAGHCWPSTFWPAAKSIVAPQMLLQHEKSVGAAELPAEASNRRSAAAGSTDAAAATPAVAAGGRDVAREEEGEVCHRAAVVSDNSSGRLSLLDAAVPAVVLKIKDAHAAAGDSSSCVEQSTAVKRTVSSGSGCTRSTAFALSSRLSCELDLSHDHGSYGSCGCLAGECSSSITSPAVQQQQSGEQHTLILHKVRLAGPCELESLLFANPTTSHPDTTVARILKPSHSMVSWPSVQVLSPSAAALAGSSPSLAAGGVHMQHHSAPQRSASVSIAALAMRRSGSARHSTSSSHSSSGGWCSLREAAAAADSAYLGGKRSNSSWGRDSSSQGTLLASSSGLYSPSRAAHDIQQQQQQLDVLHVQMQLQHEQPQVSGTVKKARSYQALSALHAAGMRTATSLPAQPGLAGTAAAEGIRSSSMRSSATRPGHSLGGAELAAAAAAGAVPRAGGGMAFRSVFSNSGEDGQTWPAAAAAAAEIGSQGSQRSAARALQRAWTTSNSPSGAAQLQLQLSSQQQQHQSLGVAMPLSCPAEGLVTEAAADEAACEGKVRGGVSRDQRRSSFRLISEEEAAAAAAADALQAALGQLAEKQEKVLEGKVRRGSRRGSLRCLSDDAEVAAGVAEAMHRSSSAAQQQQLSASEGLTGNAAATTAGVDAAAPAAAGAGSTWQSKLKGAADRASKVAFKAANSVGQPFSSSSSSDRDTAAPPGIKQQQQGQRQKEHSQPLPQIESSVRGGQAKAARLRGSASTPDLPSLAAARAAADAAFDQAAVSAVRAKLTSSGSARSSWDAASSSSAASSAAAAAPRGIPMPSRIMGMGKKLPKLHRKPHSGGRGAGSSVGSDSSSAAVSRSSDMLVLGDGHSMSGCSVLSGSSGANSRGSSIEVSFSAPQGPALASPHAAGVASGSASLAAVTEAAVHGGKGTAAAEHTTSSGSLVSAFSSAAGTAAAAGCGDAAGLDISREASSCLSVGCESAAGGAVHGGELGATALEGQMHGGKRSSSLNLTGSMLLPSLSFTSSGGDDADYASVSCLSSPSQQLHTSLFSSGSFAESSSPLQRHQNSLEAAANAAAASASAAAAVPNQVSRAGVRCEPGDSTAAPSAAAAELGGGADRRPPGIQVLKMPSGSFTRVRLAASAPAGDDDGSNSLAGSSSDIWSPEPTDQQGAGDSSSRQQQLLLGQRQYVTSCVQLQHYSSAKALDDNPCGVIMPKPYPGMRRAASSGGIVRHAASICTELPSRYSSGSSRAGDDWSSSRAWGGGGGSRPNAIQFGKVPLPGPFSGAAAAATGASKTVTSPPRGTLPGTSSSGGGTVFRSAFRESRGAVNCNPSSPVPNVNSAGSDHIVRVSFGDGVLGRPQQQQQRQQQAEAPHTAAAAAAAASETAYELLGMQRMQPNQLPGTKRQKSTPLPTLQESPTPTPGTSPQPPSKDGSAAAAARDIPEGSSLALNEVQLQAVQLQQQLGLISQQQQQQQQWPQQSAALELELSDSPATAGSFSGAIIGSFEEDHSLADFLAEAPEELDGFGSFVGSGGSGQLPGSSDLAVSASGVSGQQQQQQPESPPCGRRDGRSFEFSRPHNVFGALYDSSSPAQVGNPLLQS